MSSWTNHWLCCVVGRAGQVLLPHRSCQVSSRKVSHRLVPWEIWCTCHLLSSDHKKKKKSCFVGVLSCSSPKSSTSTTILKAVSLAFWGHQLGLQLILIVAISRQLYIGIFLKLCMMIVSGFTYTVDVIMFVFSQICAILFASWQLFCWCVTWSSS